MSPVLPFGFTDYQSQPNCFFTVMDSNNYSYLGIFFDRIQALYPELKSDVLSQGYIEIASRITPGG